MRRLKFISALFATLLFIASCTDNFEEFNTPNDKITQDEIENTIKGGLTVKGSLLNIYHPSRYRFWRYNVIHASRFGGYFRFGYKESWWDDGLSYNYSTSYTDASWAILEASGGITQMLSSRAEETPDYGVALVVNALLYHKAVDTWGDLPFNRAEDTKVYTPQADIYRQLITDLSDAIKYIGDATSGRDGSDDPLFEGDLQKWKKLANSLMLKLALRARGSANNDFSEAAINEALLNNVFLEAGEDAGISIATGTSEWANSTYNGIWKTGAGGQWRVSKTMVDLLQGDPRLEKLVSPIEIDKDSIFTLERQGLSGTPAYDNHAEMVDEVVDVLTEGGLSVTRVAGTGDDLGIDVAIDISAPSSDTYLGQKARYNGEIQPFLYGVFFSKPSEYVRSSDTKYDTEIMPTYVMTAAEAYFYRAEAAMLGYGGDGAALFNSGMEAAMTQHGLSGAPVLEFNEENLYNQLWLSVFGSLGEGWSVARRTGYPKALKVEEGYSNNTLFIMGDVLQGSFPQRMRYGSTEQIDNSTYYDQAVASQGADTQSTKLWIFTK